jgi:tetratricopeptide (TPR) repeat protein
MNSSRVVTVCGALLLAAIAGAGFWWWQAPADVDPAETADLPVPPFPPRITQGSDYEACLAALADDPDGAIAIAESWQAGGGGDGAAHCRGLALVAIGRPEEGAAVLEQLSQTTTAPPLAKASLLYQAVQARMMVDQAEQARADATAALALSPNDTDLMVGRAAAEASLGAVPEALRDLGAALERDATRADALIARAALYRAQGQIDLAKGDIEKALALDPDDADALLERGILRQRSGDLAGARADWEHARGTQPDSATADRAEQNLSLLDAGPAQ